MKKIIHFGLLFCFFSCKKPGCPEPVTIISQPTTTQPTTPTATSRFVTILQPGSEGKDASLSNIGSDQNFPSKTYIHARTWTVNGYLSLEKGIFQFDYSSIPAGATITKAILTLFADTTLNTGSLGHSTLGGSNDWVLKRVTQSWEETTVTWDTEPQTDQNNMLQCAASTSPSQAYEFDLTSWVIDEISHPTAYYGFLMELNSTDHYAAMNFCSSDNKYPALHPKMVIEYTK